MPTPIDSTGTVQAAAPAPQDKQVLSAALGFERMLVAQLAKSLLPQDDDAEASPYADALPGALADGIEQVGGLGLAPELARTLGGQA